MDYQIVLSPDLEVSAGEFAEHWNLSPQGDEIGNAATAPAAAKSFLDPNIVLAVIAGAAGKIAVDVIKDLVKEKVKALIREKFARKDEVEVESVLQPDGTYLIIVKR